MFIHKGQQKTRREIGFFALVILGLSSMIGSGVFVLLGPGAEIAGKLLPFSFLVAGILSILVVAVYAEFTSAMPTSGSSLSLLFEAYGLGPLSFIVSWLVVLGNVAYSAINGLGFGYYASLFLPVSPVVIALVVIALVGVLNLKGVEQTVSLQNFVGGLLVLALTTIIILSFFQFDLSIPSYFKDLNLKGRGWIALFPIFSALAVIYTSFIGVEDIAAVAGEVKKPAKTLPKALFTTITTAIVVFVLLSFVAVEVVSIDQLATSDAALFLLGESLGPVAEIIVFIAVFLATFTSVMVMTLVSTRELHAIAERGFLGGFLEKLNKARIPSRCLWVVVVLTAMLILTDSARFTAYLGNSLYLIGVVLISYAVIKMRKKRPYMERPYKVPLFPWIPIVVIVLGSFVLFFVSLKALLATACWALFGFIIYLASWVDKQRIKLMLLGVLSLFLLVGLISVLYFGFIL
ncbi:MAG: APC family permease [Patescibacteria group bacterium]